MSCETLPVCQRCSRAACDHGESFPPAIPDICVGYVGWPDCHVCGQTSWTHDYRAPHGIEGVCAGYDPGEEYQGEGGGFGGGGASGGW